MRLHTALKYFDQLRSGTLLHPSPSSGRANSPGVDDKIILGDGPFERLRSLFHDLFCALAGISYALPVDEGGRHVSLSALCNLAGSVALLARLGFPSSSSSLIALRRGLLPEKQLLN